MKRVAVTGGRGRLAPGLAAHLRDAGHQVVLFSRDASGTYDDVNRLADHAVLESFDAVLHLGWSTVPLVAEESPGIEEQSDLPFVRALAAAAAKCVDSPQIVFFSTAAVYGDTGTLPATEETHRAPLGRYAAGKLRAEEMLASCRSACVLRITNVFAAGCPLTRPQGIIPVLLRAARDGGKVQIWGDGSATKDYLSGFDLHRAVEAAIGHRLKGVFNVSSGFSLSVNRLVALVEEISGRKIEREHLPHYPWDVSLAHVSSAKLQIATGWRPNDSPEEFIRALPD